MVPGPQGKTTVPPLGWIPTDVVTHVWTRMINVQSGARYNTRTTDVLEEDDLICTGVLR